MIEWVPGTRLGGPSVNDLDRMILRKVQNLPGTVTLDAEDCPGFSNERIQARVRMLVEGGLVHGTVTAAGPVPVWGLTASGTEALAAEEN